MLNIGDYLKLALYLKLVKIWKKNFNVLPIFYYVEVITDFDVVVSKYLTDPENYENKKKKLQFF